MRESLEANLKRHRTSEGQQGDINGETDAVGHALWALDVAGYPDDAITQGTVEILMEEQASAGFWKPALQRPPTVGSYFTSTYVALRALNRFASLELRNTVARQNVKALGWLKSTIPTDTEDRVYRLRALQLLEPDGEAFLQQVESLLATRNEWDGGWPQMEDRRSDAYATGTVLAALWDTRAVSTKHEAFRAGVRYILETQERSGGWHVRNRTAPVQPFFASGFPFERDQFISIAGSSWATYSLLAALSDRGHRGTTAFLETHPLQTRDSRGVTVAGADYFLQKIEPVLKEKCYQCHSQSSEEVKGDLTLDSAAGLAKGGINGPIINREYPDESLLLRSLLAEGDMSLMPPKHPLPEATIKHFREWIRQGAPDARH